MKLFGLSRVFSLALAFALGSAAMTASAAVIYDDFVGDADTAPNAALWTITGSSATSLLDGSGVLNQTSPGGNTDMLSTATYASGRFGFQLAGVANGAARGFGISFAPYLGAPASRILLRTDFGGGLQFEVYNGATQVQELLTAGLDSAVDDFWEFDYAPGTIALYRNGDLVIGPQATGIVSTEANFSMFAYSGGAHSFDFVSIPEPSSMAMFAMASVLGLGFYRRKR